MPTHEPEYAYLDVMPHNQLPTRMVNAEALPILMTAFADQLADLYPPPHGLGHALRRIRRDGAMRALWETLDTSNPAQTVAGWLKAAGNEINLNAIQCPGVTPAVQKQCNVASAQLRSMLR